MTITPCVIIPGYFATAADYVGMQQWLHDQRIPSTIVPLTKFDWLPTFGGRSVAPILQAIDQTVQRTRTEYRTDQVNLIGHSAGGWIARIYLGDVPYDVHPRTTSTPEHWSGYPQVARLISLGTPHSSCDRWTRKNLEFVNQTYPGAFYHTVQYTCIAGRTIQGAKRFGQWLAYNSYELTGGQGDAWGDGITPVAAAHLAGARNIELADVWHSPRSPGRWYGSPEVMRHWVDYLIA